MRLGSVLLIGGFLLCVSIVWAALGFFMMGLGLICLLIAEERNKRFQKLTASRFDERHPRAEPRLSPEPAAPLSSKDEPPNSIGYSFDHEEKWKSLVENDPDLGRLVAVLVPYGQKYVDELARAYLVLNDKDYLPMIIKKIIASARKDAGKDVTSELMVLSNPNAGAVGTRNRRSREYRARDLRINYEVVADSSVLTNTTPRLDPDTKSPSMQSTRNNLPGGGCAADRREPELEKADENKIADVTAPEPAKEVTRSVYLDAAENLADLLSSLDPKRSLKQKNKSSPRPASSRQDIAVRLCLFRHRTRSPLTACF